VGVADVRFDYSAFEKTRVNLIKSVNEVLTNEDKLFLIAFEKGEPNYEVSEYDSFKKYAHYFSWSKCAKVGSFFKQTTLRSRVACPPARARTFEQPNLFRAAQKIPCYVL